MRWCKASVPQHFARSSQPYWQCAMARPCETSCSGAASSISPKANQSHPAKDSKLMMLDDVVVS